MRLPRVSLSQLFPVLLCLLLGLVSCRVYLRSGVPITHDGENHLARFANYKVALREGQILPRFAPNLFHRYGYPVFNYNYPLPNLLSVPFSIVKTPYQLTFKIIVTAATTLLLLGVWQWLRLLRFHPWARTLATTSVAVSPYLLQTVIYRGSIGEVLAFAGIVWWLVWAESVRQKRNGEVEHTLNVPISWIQFLFSAQTLWGGILLGAFFLSHNVSVLFGTPLLLLVAVWRIWPTKPNLLKVVGAFLIGLGLSVWFWIPALAEQSEIIVSGSSLSAQYLQQFPTFHQLLTGPLQFGYSYTGAVDSLSFALGWGQWLAVILVTGWMLAALWGQRQARRMLDQVVIIFFLASLGLTLFQLSATAPVWQAIPLARFIQFPWRLGAFSIITNAVLIAWVVQKGVRWQTVLLSLALCIQLIVGLRMTPIGYLNKQPIEYELFEQSTTTSNENLPQSFTFQNFADWQPTAAIEAGEGAISVHTWRGSSRTYSVTAETPVTVVEPTMYFPGWETTVTSGNSFRLVSYLNNESIGGRIAYQLDPGIYEVKTEFTQFTPPRFIGNTISTFTVALVVGGLCWWLYVQLFRKTRQTYE